MTIDHEPTTSSSTGVLFISSITLIKQETPTERKKWSRFSDRFPTAVICFSEEGFSTGYRHGVQFVTYPSTYPLPVRLFLYYLLTPLLACYLTIRHSLTVWIAQSPYEAGAVWLPALLLGPLGDVRLIVEAHGDWIESFFELRSVPLQSLVKRCLSLYSRWVLWRADGLRSVSDHTRTLLNRYTPSNVPHRIFPTFTDLDLFLETTLSEKKSAESNYVVYVGALTDLKGIDDLLRALSLSRQNGTTIPLQLVGQGPRESDFRSLTHELNLQSLVEFRGRLSSSGVRGALLGARLLVLPSHTEGMPRVLLEAMACYTPYVSTETPGVVELTEKSRGGITVPVSNPEQLSRAMMTLYEDTNERRQHGRSGRRYVEENHSTKAYFEHYTELIHTVAQDS